MPVLSNARTLSVATIAVGLTLAAAAPEAHADDFYKGQRITIIVGSGAGGGYDTYARLVARHLGNFIPGDPTFVVQNMPGAGSIKALNYVTNVSPKDGTVIGAVQRDAAMVELLGKPGPQFKAVELFWLGNLVTEPGVCGVSAKTGIKSFDEVFKRELVVGGSGPNALEHYPALFNNILGAKFKVVRGYKSSTEVGLALERGEVEGVCQSASSFLQHHAAGIAKGDVIPLVQVALQPHPELEKRGVPMFTKFVTPERVQGGLTTKDAIEHFNLQLAATLFGRPYLLAPGVPAERANLMRASFTKMAKSEKFLGDANAQKREINFVTGEELNKIVADVAKVPKERLAKLEDLLKLP